MVVEYREKMRLAEAITEDIVKILHVRVMVFNGVQLSEFKALTIMLILVVGVVSIALGNVGSMYDIVINAVIIHYLYRPKSIFW
jgi:hypothetical protein